MLYKEIKQILEIMWSRLDRTWLWCNVEEDMTEECHEPSIIMVTIEQKWIVESEEAERVNVGCDLLILKHEFCIPEDTYQQTVGL